MDSLPGRGLDQVSAPRGDAHYWLWVPVLALVGGALVPLLVDLSRLQSRRELVLVTALVGGGLAHAGYVVAIGGDSCTPGC
jgi:hypothetical protein